MPKLLKPHSSLSFFLEWSSSLYYYVFTESWISPVWIRIYPLIAAPGSFFFPFNTFLQLLFLTSINITLSLHYGPRQKKPNQVICLQFSLHGFVYWINLTKFKFWFRTYSWYINLMADDRATVGTDRCSPVS